MEVKCRRAGRHGRVRCSGARVSERALKSCGRGEKRLKCLRGKGIACVQVTVCTQAPTRVEVR